LSMSEFQNKHSSYTRSNLYSKVSGWCKANSKFSCTKRSIWQTTSISFHSFTSVVQSCREFASRSYSSLRSRLGLIHRTILQSSRCWFKYKGHSKATLLLTASVLKRNFKSSSVDAFKQTDVKTTSSFVASVKMKWWEISS
jgi:hypothetical protein